MSNAPFRQRAAAAHSVRRWDQSESRGSASVELVLLAPVLVLLFMLVIYAGQAGQGVEQVRHAADQGARAASMARRPAMSAAARQAVAADLEQNGRPCGTYHTSVQFQADTVTVSVHCWTNGAGFWPLRLSDRVILASSTEIIDRYRGGP
jgi:Flp pilus assembly protein TadG